MVIQLIPLLIKSTVVQKPHSKIETSYSSSTMAITKRNLKSLESRDKEAKDTNIHRRKSINTSIRQMASGSRSSYGINGGQSTPPAKEVYQTMSNDEENLFVA